MKIVALALAFAALSSASPGEATPPARASETPGRSELMTAMRGSEFAEIYLIDRSILFPIEPRPSTLKSSGCRYFVHRNSREWRELERALTDADIGIEPSTAMGEVRVALILGDRAGTLWEAYTRYPYPSESTVPGFSQRRQVAISAGFVLALESFAERHPELALASTTQMPVCPNGTSGNGMQ